MVPGDTLETALAVTALVALAALVFVLSRKGRTEDRARAYLAGVTYVLTDDADAAIAELSRAAQLSSQTLETYFALGALFSRKGDHARAIRLYQNMLSRPALSPEVRRRVMLALGQDFRRSGLHDKATETLNKLLALEPDAAEAVTALRQLHEECGDHFRAAELQARLVERTGEGKEILAHLLAAHAKGLCRAEPSEAVAVARRAHELWPSGAHPLHVLAHALMSQGNAREAADPLQRALSLEPELAPGSAALLLAALGPAETIAFLEARLASPDEGAAAYALALARCHRELGRTEEAIGLLRRVMEARPWRWDARRELGALLLAQDRSAELRVEYEDLLNRLGDPVMGFACGHCAQKLPEHAFRCPACGSWDSVRREPPRASLTPVPPSAAA